MGKKNNNDDFHDATAAGSSDSEVARGNEVLARMLGKPKSFSSATDQNPISWLRYMNRLRKGSRLSDEDWLLVVGSHLEAPPPPGGKTLRTRQTSLKW